MQEENKVILTKITEKFGNDISHKYSSDGHLFIYYRKQYVGKFRDSKPSYNPNQIKLGLNSLLKNINKLRFMTKQKLGKSSIPTREEIQDKLKAKLFIDRQILFGDSEEILTQIGYSNITANIDESMSLMKAERLRFKTFKAKIAFMEKAELYLYLENMTKKGKYRQALAKEIRKREREIQC
jgi:hypothetical protein